MVNQRKFFPNSGFTLLEILLVISSLSLIFIAVSNFFFSSIFSIAKSSVYKEVRQNGQYSLKMMEDLIKNSQGLVSCQDGAYTSIAPETIPPPIIVKDVNGNQISLGVINDEQNYPRIASTSAGVNYFLTSNKVKIESFEIDCGELKAGIPPLIEIKNYVISAGDVLATQEHKARLTFQAKVTFRVPYEEEID